MKSKKKTSKLRKTVSKLRKPRKKPAGDTAPPPEAPSERFLQDIAVRGEAAEPTEEGKLPPGKTHAIVEKNPDGTPKTVRRGRFYLTG